MRFTWHAHKSAKNLAARAFDFEFATLIFDGLTLERADLSRDYGEHRVIAIGMAQGIALTVVYTDRMGANAEKERRIVSARRSNRHEREAYRQAVESR